MFRKSLRFVVSTTVFSFLLVAGVGQVVAQDGPGSSADTRPTGSYTPDRSAQEDAYKRKVPLSNADLDKRFNKYASLASFLGADSSSLRTQYNRAYARNRDLVPEQLFSAKLIVFYAQQVNPSVKITEEELLSNLKKRISLEQTLRSKDFSKSEADEILRRRKAKLAEFNQKKP